MLYLFLPSFKVLKPVSIILDAPIPVALLFILEVLLPVAVILEVLELHGLAVADQVGELLRHHYFLLFPVVYHIRTYTVNQL